MEKVYQYSVVVNPSEFDWEDCSKESYYEMEGFDIPRRIVEKEVVANDWDTLWYQFTGTPEYRQSIKALQFRAFYDWLKDKFNTPTKKQYEKI